MIAPLVALVLVVVQAQQPDPPTFVMWTAEELERRDEALTSGVGPDGSSRETLADFGEPSGGRRFRLIRRESTGIPETHADPPYVDVVFVQSGEGALLVGGEQVSTPGGNVQGSRYALGQGDLMHIPAGVAHSFVVPEGGHLTYVLVRIPAFVGQPVVADDTPILRFSPPGTAVWRTSELAQRDQALSTGIGPDGSSRETLADFGNPTGAHRFRLIRRDRTGIPETHSDPPIVDVVFITSGQGAVLVGGDQVPIPGGNVGGTRYPVGAGDILHIPAGIPHSYLVPEGGHITYVLVRVPAFADDGL